MTMSTDQSTRTPKAVAERMRLYRKRRRHEQAYVRVLLSAPGIDSLVRMGLLKEERRRDPKALRDAICGFLDWALEDQKLSETIARALSPITT